MTLAIRSRLTIGYTVVFGLLLTATGLISSRVFAHQLDTDATARLTELSTGLHGYVEFENDTPVIKYDTADPDEAAFVRVATRFYQIFDADSGRPIAQSEEMKSLGLEFTPAEVRAYRDRPGPQDVRTDSGRLRIASTIHAAPSGRKYLVQVAISLEQMDRAIERFLRLLLLTWPIGLAVALLTGRWMAGLALAPLSRLAAAARTIDVADLARRVPVRDAGDELDEVAHALNDVLDRLERAIAEMRQFSAALAHELRTPLTALRAEIEGALLKAAEEKATRRLASQLEEIDKLKRLIDQILILARAEAGQIPLVFDRVDLSELASSLVEQLETVAQAKGVELRCECGADVNVRGDAEWLKRMLLNLIDNALKFTPAGGRVMVAVSHAADAATLTVTDTGVGVPPEARHRLFDRFFRADPARSPRIDGAGLGLSLVKWIVERHAGTIQVDSRMGQGTTFTVKLPINES